MKNYKGFDVFKCWDEVREEVFYEVHVKDSPEFKQCSTINDVLKYIERITKNTKNTKAKVTFDFDLKEIYA